MSKQDRQSSKELVVFLVDASPKMFNTTCSAVRTYTLFLHFYLILVYNYHASKIVKGFFVSPYIAGLRLIWFSAYVIICIHRNGTDFKLSCRTQLWRKLNKSCCFVHFSSLFIIIKKNFVFWNLFGAWNLSPKRACWPVVTPAPRPLCFDPFLLNLTTC